MYISSNTELTSSRAELHLTAWTFSQKCLSLDPTVNSLEGGQCVTPRHLHHCFDNNIEITIFSGKNHPILNVVQPWIVITVSISDQILTGQKQPSRGVY